MHKQLFNKTPFLFIFLLLLLIAGHLAQSQESELPKEAQQVMASGLEAAKLKDWDSAIKQFREAQKLALDSPQVLFNLALAYDKAGDKELPALALYGAYLIVAPDATNSQAVQARIKELDAQVETNIRSLILSAQKAAATIPDDVFTYGSTGVSLEAKLPYFKNVYNSIADAQINLGDFPGARATLAKVRELQDAIKSLPGFHDTTEYSYLALNQASAGDIDGALKTAALIQDEKTGEFYRGMSYKNIVTAQLERNDIAGAEKTARLITHKYFNDLAKRSFVKTKLKARDIPAAMSLASGIQGDAERAYAYLEIAQLELEKKDASGALESLNEAYQATNLLKDDDGGHRPILYYSIAEAQFKAGDTDAALKTLAQVEKSDMKTPDESSFRFWRYWIVAEIAANSQDLKKVKELLAQAKDGLQKLKTPHIFDQVFYAYGNIARLQNKIGDAEGARKTIAESTKIVLEGKNSDGGASAFLNLGRGWGDMKSAKVMYLANFPFSFRIGWRDSSPLLADWPGWQKFMQLQKENKNPDESVQEIAEVAEYLSKAVKQIRAEDEEWQD